MLEELRQKQPELRTEILSYNGILDPMAEGIVPVLVGEENKRRDDFTGSEKVYEVEVLTGVSTDSGDLLGVVNNSNTDVLVEQSVPGATINSRGKFEQIVPMHSNRKVNGKRLWWWALHGTEIPKEHRPKNVVELKQITFGEKREISRVQLQQEIDLMRENIGERFRLLKVATSWEDFFSNSSQKNFNVFRFDVHVTSGFYVRTFVEEIGEQLRLPMVVYSLKRTKVIYSHGSSIL